MNLNCIAPKFQVGFILMVIWASLILSGCDPNQESLLRKITPAEDEAVATNYIALLRQNKFEPILANADQSLKSVFTKELLVKMANAIPPQDPISIKIVGVQRFHNSDFSSINLAFEYQFSTNWMVINVMTQKKGGISTIVGFHVYDFGDSLENRNKFTLSGKSFLQYVTLALGILIPIFIFCVLVLCIRTKMEKKKWLWIIFILFGIGRFTVNWTTNRWGVSPLYVLLFGSGSFAPPFGPWLISIAFPLGAIIFLIRRKKLKAQNTPPSQIRLARKVAMFVRGLLILEFGCPTWIRTMNNASKGRCVTITPSDKPL